MAFSDDSFEREWDDVSISDIEAEEIRETVERFLGALDVPYASTSKNEQPLCDLCFEDMAGRAWSEETKSVLRTYIKPSASLVLMAYSHLSRTTQIYITLYNAALMCFEDIVAGCRSSRQKAFHSALLQNRAQRHGVFEACTEIIQEAPLHYGKYLGGIVMSSTLRFITSLEMEQESSVFKSPRKSRAKSSRRIRELPGAQEAYIIFAFPRSVPYTAFIRALPEMTKVISYGNDVLSFYKDELAGEEENLISFLSEATEMPKTEVHEEMTEEALQCDESIVEFLEGDQEALDAYTSFRTGYAAYHLCTPRYKLRKLLEL